MRQTKKALLSLLLLALLMAGSFVSLQKFPINLFLLKGLDRHVEAYRIQLFLNKKEPSLEAVLLSREQASQGLDILKKQDLRQLIEFSNYFGKSEMVIGFPTSEEGWPSYLGNGWRVFFGSDSNEVFDNLQWADRLYLALRFHAPPTPGLTASGKTLDDSLQPESILVKPASTIASTPSAALRVEILNGCGIKGAADWAARRLKGEGIIITGTGNAEHFRFAQTIVRTSAGIPIALEEAVERLGLNRESVEESTNPTAAVDVVVIVGKDFRKIKERVRERNQH